MTRATLCSLLVIALAGALAACGSADRHPRRTPRPSAAQTTSSGGQPTPARQDNDGDGDGGGDDNGWGREATAGDRRAATALVRRYYAVAAQGNGAGACSLLYSLFAEEVPEIYGEQPDEPALRGKTCAVVTSKLFRRLHRQLLEQTASLKVIGVRIRGLRGLALLRFKGMRERDIPIHREHRAWKIAALIDSGLG